MGNYALIARVDGLTAENAALMAENAALREKLKKEGALGGKFFFEGKKAHDGNDAIIYNAKDGKLAYDKNGDDSGGVKTFAILSAGLDLSKDDFLVV